jgi:hypothetical protein
MYIYIYVYIDLFSYFPFFYCIMRTVFVHLGFILMCVVWCVCVCVC